MDEELITGSEAFFRFLIDAMSFIFMIVFFVYIRKTDDNLNPMSWEWALLLAIAVSYGASGALRTLFDGTGDIKYRCSFFGYFVVLLCIIGIMFN